MKESGDLPDFRGIPWLPSVNLEVKTLLDRLEVKPSKSMGQNFLTDSTIAQSIVSEINPGRDDVVIEIGPGTGSLSRYLAGRVRRLILVEFDRRLADFLRVTFAGDSSVEVEHADATKFDLRSLFAEGPVKVIGNLPYSCGGEIIRKFLDPPTPVTKGVFMLQKEVAERLAAIPRTKAYGRVTLLTAVGWEVEQLFTLPPDPFYPRPAVDSSVVRVGCRLNGEIEPFNRQIFDRLLRCGFSQRRKQLKKLLPLGELSWSGVCKVLGIAERARAEELCLDEWLQLTRLLDPHPLKDIPQCGDEIFDVVDDNNVVLGQSSRDEVHAKGLLHRAVHIFVFNILGELYLQKRSSSKDSSPGLWDSSASGHLGVGEDYQSAAARELREELGVQAPVEEISALAACPATGWEFVRLFRCEHGGPFLSPCSEVETGTFLSPEIIDQWVSRRPQDFAPGFVECWSICSSGMPSRVIPN
ncbi:MAG: 16S rRNA (adenine(1518)-N(6)/adenine(1519)-N(6))-dimethyltransferase RsmA [Verrucomicrobiales bacterium]